MTVQSASVSLLEAHAVTFLRHDQPVFAPQSFRLCAGELVWVEGDNGSGKTTLLRVLAGLLHAGTGTLHWRGKDLERDDSAGEILYIGHQLGLKADLTARENLRIASGLHGSRPAIEPGQVLRDVGLRGYEDEPVRRLSAGQKKRVALARLLLLPAVLWLLDEPYANLDRVGAALVDHILGAHAAAGGAALVTTHTAPGPDDGRWRRIRLGA